MCSACKKVMNPSLKAIIMGNIKYSQIIFLLILLVNKVNYTNCDSFQVTLYDHQYYKGPSRSFNVSRCHNLFNINFNDRSSSILIPSCVRLYDDVCCQGKSKRIRSSVNDLEDIKFDNKLTSISPCEGFVSPAPHQIHETWAGHGQIMTRVAEGQDIAIYYNDDVRRTSIRFHSEYLRKLWRHVKSTYGGFGPESGRLFAFFHSKVPSSVYVYNSIQSYFDIHGECRNIIDLVGRDEDAWSKASNATEDTDTINKVVSHIVEWASKGVHGSPTYQLWGDSAWAEIFTFDAYYSLGLQKERERWYLQMVNSKYGYPRRNTYWFRDWFYPIYKNHGGAHVLSSYFDKLALHFPRKENGWEYARDINLGEFVHFFSGAARADLKEHAIKAFSWGSNAERQLLEAKRKFPEIWY